MVKLEKEVSPINEVQYEVQPVLGLQRNIQVTIMQVEQSMGKEINAM